MGKIYKVNVGGVENKVEIEATGDNSYNVTLNNIVYPCSVVEDNNKNSSSNENSGS